MFFKSKTEIKTFIFQVNYCNLLKFIHAADFLTYAGRKYILVEKQIAILTQKYRFQKKVTNLRILEAATDMRSVKIGISEIYDQNL